MNPEHDLRGGPLLRCDLHGLFDRWFITIDLSLVNQDRTRAQPLSGLAELDGRTIELPADLRPQLE